MRRDYRYVRVRSFGTHYNYYNIDMKNYIKSAMRDEHLILRYKKVFYVRIIYFIAIQSILLANAPLCSRLLPTKSEILYYYYLNAFTAHPGGGGGGGGVAFRKSSTAHRTLGRSYSYRTGDRFVLSFFSMLMLLKNAQTFGKKLRHSENMSSKPSSAEMRQKRTLFMFEDCFRNN